MATAGRSRRSAGSFAHVWTADTGDNQGHEPSSGRISPQNLAIGAAAVGLAGKEGDIFRKVIGWSLVLVLVMFAIVYLQSTDILSWMVV